jgi:hypothetical protein
MAELVFPTNPMPDEFYTGNGKTWKWNGLGWELAGAAVKPYDIALFLPGTPDVGELLLAHVPATKILFPVNLSGSRAVVNVAPAIEVILSIKKNAVEVATLTFAQGETDGVFASTTAFFVDLTDMLEVYAPAGAGASTLEDLILTLSATRV